MSITMNNAESGVEQKPWYREFWLWFVLAIPLFTVVSGVFLIWIASDNADSVVVDSYYKQGLAINWNLSREQRAQQLGIQAEIHISSPADAAAGIVTLTLTAKQAITAKALRVQWIHPTLSKLDQTTNLTLISPQHYRGIVDYPMEGERIVIVEPDTESSPEPKTSTDTLAPEKNDWRLQQRIQVSPHTTIHRMGQS